MPTFLASSVIKSLSTLSAQFSLDHSPALSGRSWHSIKFSSMKTDGKTTTTAGTKAASMLKTNKQLKAQPATVSELSAPAAWLQC